MGMFVFKTVDFFVKTLEKSHIVRMQSLDDTGVDEWQGSQPEEDPAEQYHSKITRITLYPRVSHWQNLVLAVASLMTPSL